MRSESGHETVRYQALLYEVLKRSCSAVVLLNTDAEIVFCTPGVEGITGYSSEALVGKTAFDFFHPANHPVVRQQYRYLAGLNGKAAASLIQICHREGYLTWIDIVVENLLQVAGVNALFVLLKKSGDIQAEELKLVQAVVEAKEQERQWLATELHDNINQVITATGLLINMVRNHPGRKELLDVAADNLQLVSGEIRKLSYSMVSYDLHEFGLAVAFKAFMHTIDRACSVQFCTRLEQEALEQLTAGQQLQVYRILQECVVNIIRHAHATQAEMVLARKEQFIYLTVTDNGNGIPFKRLKPGVGLSSITNRVKILGGHFRMRSPGGKGTTIEIHFPV